MAISPPRGRRVRYINRDEGDRRMVVVVVDTQNCAPNTSINTNDVQMLTGGRKSLENIVQNSSKRQKNEIPIIEVTNSAPLEHPTHLLDTKPHSVTINKTKCDKILQRKTSTIIDNEIGLVIKIKINVDNSIFLNFLTKKRL